MGNRKCGYDAAEKIARELIEKKLRSGFRSITRFFADAIASVELHGISLPFWVFDAEMNVAWSWSAAPEHGVHPV